MDTRVRRRDLKVGKVFICNYEGTLSHPTHSCKKGEPVIIQHIYKPGTIQGASTKVAAICKFISRVGGYVCQHSFRLCDLRKMTKEDWS